MLNSQFQLSHFYVNYISFRIMSNNVTKQCFALF